MALTARQKRRIEKMAREGITFSFISKIIFGDFEHYDEILYHCWETGCLSWQGAKKMISIRLKRISLANLPQLAKMQAIKEISEYVEYLYQCGKALQQKLDKIREAAR